MKSCISILTFMLLVLLSLKPAYSVSHHLETITSSSVAEGIRSSNSCCGGLANDIASTLTAIDGEYHPSLVQLLYDDKHEETAAVLSQTLSSKMFGFLVVQYETSIKTTKKLISSAWGKTLLLVLCSPSKILDIFSVIRLNYLDSHFVSWLLVLKGNEDLNAVLVGLNKGLVFEGTRVTVVAEVAKGLPLVFTTAVDSDGITRLHDQGNWGKTDESKTKHLLDLLVPDEKRLINMKGRVLNVTTLERMPHFGISPPNPDGSVNATGGFELMILQTLGTIFNFTFRVILPADGSFGNPLPDGTVTGMIGLVARREASLAFGGVTLTDARDKVIDFSIPFYQGYLCIFSTPPKEKNKALAVLSPFTYEVWICIIISTAAIGPVLFGVSKAAAKMKTSESSPLEQSYAFNMFRNIVNQGNSLDLGLWSERIILLCWFLFCLVCSALYSGTLTAVLAVPAYEKPINSLQDLPQAVKRGMTLLVNGATTHEFIFKVDENDGGRSHYQVGQRHILEADAVVAEKHRRREPIQYFGNYSQTSSGRISCGSIWVCHSSSGTGPGKRSRPNQGKIVLIVEADFGKTGK
ncbi:uncharacterized protein LOC135225510 isoform X2 [Macrobrachium nipponense]|uniref:uncharacterized protein LOC135225510 isoform X2 n=1 Tax=Macrobrachium nipponense TaxID=159736 RepID=UPI0030C8C7C7